jgi:small conductance mechanosensitive channel
MIQTAWDIFYGLLRGGLLLVAAWWLGGWLRGVASRWLEERVDANWRAILAGLVRWLPVALVMQKVLEGVGIPAASFIAGLSAIGLAIAIALKDSLTNAASGAVLLTTRPFHVGDTVTVGGFPSPVTGVVRRIGFLTLELDAEDGSRVTLTHDRVIAAPIERHAVAGQARLEVEVRVPRAAFTAELLEKLAPATHSEGLPPGSVTPLRFDGDGVVLLVRAWCRADERSGAHAALLLRLNPLLPT